MSGSAQYTFKMPDLGEGTVEAEIVRWYVQPGDRVSEDQAIVEVMTDKASVEVPAPVSGRVHAVTGTPGDKIAVGSPLIVFDLEAQAAGTAVAARTSHGSTADSVAARATAAAPARAAIALSAAAAPARIMASPANRRRAREAGLELSTLVGSGPRGRILQSDIVAASSRSGSIAPHASAQAPPTAASLPGLAAGATTEIKVIGLRRL
ncbi:MAG TPA: biotin/lipoyl-containing protein, partial [Steroidobacteraceae bacterium]|nr:biotin/lipoyl-containing protein [Steroidobacteraceae bacterium]